LLGREELILRFLWNSRFCSAKDWFRIFKTISKPKYLHPYTPQENECISFHADFVKKLRPLILGQSTN
jgi:hypothetical protein